MRQSFGLSRYFSRNNTYVLQKTIFGLYYTNSGKLAENMLYGNIVATHDASNGLLIDKISTAGQSTASTTGAIRPSQNLLSLSNSIGAAGVNPGWSLSSVFATRCAEPDRFGLPSTRISESRTNNVHFVSAGIGSFSNIIANGTPYTFSLDLKAGTRRFVTVYLSNTPFSRWYGIKLDLVSGTIYDSTLLNMAGIDSEIVYTTDGWYRVRITASPVAMAGVNANLLRFSLYLNQDAFLPNVYLGAGEYVYTANWQVEAGSVMTDYVDTDRTRSAQQIKTYAVNNQLQSSINNSDSSLSYSYATESSAASYVAKWHDIQLFATKGNALAALDNKESIYSYHFNAGSVQVVNGDIESLLSNKDHNIALSYHRGGVESSATANDSPFSFTYSNGLHNVDFSHSPPASIELDFNSSPGMATAQYSNNSYQFGLTYEKGDHTFNYLPFTPIGHLHVVITNGDNTGNLIVYSSGKSQVEERVSIKLDTVSEFSCVIEVSGA